MKHVYYCAIGARYAEMARISAASARRHNPDLVITLLTDQDIKSGPFDHVLPTEDNPADIVAIKLARISLLEAVKAEQALFLDCDTFVVGDLSPAFDVLKTHEIAVAYDTWRNCSVTPQGTYMNCGVIFFRSCQRVREFLHEWKRRFRADPRLPIRPELIRDQPSFESALHDCGLRIFVLPPEYNVRVCEPVHIGGRAAILHGDFAAMLDGSIERLGKFLNSETGPRVFIPSTGQMLVCDFAGLRERHFSQTGARQSQDAAARG